MWAGRHRVLSARTGKLIGAEIRPEQPLDGLGRVLRDYYATLKQKPIPEPIAALLSSSREKSS